MILLEMFLLEYEKLYAIVFLVVSELLPMPFDGIRATFNKGLSHHFQVTHSFALGTMQRSGYKFGATYAGTKQLSQTEVGVFYSYKIKVQQHFCRQLSKWWQFKSKGILA